MTIATLIGILASIPHLYLTAKVLFRVQEYVYEWKDNALAFVAWYIAGIAMLALSLVWVYPLGMWHNSIINA